MGFLLTAKPVSPEVMAHLRSFLAGADWEVVEGRGYQTADITHLTEGAYKRAFFIKLPPHTQLHRHTDCGDCRTDHIVMQTNPLAINWWLEGDTELCAHMQENCRYEVDRTVPHWAVNDGDSDRIHLMLEY